MENEHIKVVIVTKSSGEHPIGSIVGLYDKDLDPSSNLVDPQYFLLGLTANGYMPINSQALRNDNGDLIISFENLIKVDLIKQVSGVITFSLKERNIRIKIVLTPKIILTGVDNLQLVYFTTYWDTLSIYNHTGMVKSFDLRQPFGPLENFIDPILVFKKNNGQRLRLTMHNPFESFFYLKGGGDTFEFKMQLIPHVYSTIDRGDKIEREFEIQLLNNDTQLEEELKYDTYFSPVPSAHEQALMLMFEHGPATSYSRYTPFTTGDNTRDVILRGLIKLLENHTEMKIGLLLLLDPLLGFKDHHFAYWYFDPPYASPDSLTPFRGQYTSAASLKTVSNFRIYQPLIPVEPNRQYEVSYFVKVDSPGLSPGYVYAEVTDINLVGLGMKTYQEEDYEWKEDSFTFSTGDEDIFVNLYFKVNQAKGTVYFDNVSLHEVGDTTNLVWNPGFEDYRPLLRSEPNATGFWDVHGPTRMATELPNPYLQRFRDIQKDSVIYGWEDRMRLGVHGYHHTPSLGKPDPYFEFMYYDPEGDKARFDAIAEDLYMIGLDGRSKRFIRFPGFTHTESAINEIIKRNFILYDMGINLLRFKMKPVKKYNKTIWGITTCTWLDYGSPSMDFDLTYSILSKGKIALLGGHPLSMFRKWGVDQFYFDYYDSIFHDIENSFPDLVYLFPDEMGEFAEETSEIKNINVTTSNDTIVLTFEGRVTMGQTIVVQYSDPVLEFSESRGLKLEAAVDNELLISPIVRKGKLFYVLPRLNDGTHSFVVAQLATEQWYNPPFSFQLSQNHPNPFNPITTIEYTLQKSEKVLLTVYNLLGEEVTRLIDERIHTGVHQVTWDATNSASGIYFYRLQAGDFVQTRKMVLLK